MPHVADDDNWKCFQARIHAQTISQIESISCFVLWFRYLSAKVTLIAVHKLSKFLIIYLCLLHSIDAVLSLFWLIRKQSHNSISHLSAFEWTRKNTQNKLHTCGRFCPLRAPSFTLHWNTVHLSHTGAKCWVFFFSPLEALRLRFAMLQMLIGRFCLRIHWIVQINLNELVTCNEMHFDSILSLWTAIPLNSSNVFQSTSNPILKNAFLFFHISLCCAFAKWHSEIISLVFMTISIDFIFRIANVCWTAADFSTYRIGGMFFFDTANLSSSVEFQFEYNVYSAKKIDQLTSFIRIEMDVNA